ncbi:MAG TPA: Sua5 family C-terminal domain-containing protein, partial [Acidimicrobiia bacterium]
SPTTAADVVADLSADVDVVLDGGPCRVGVESTIVDCARLDQPHARPAILRVGGVSREQVEELLGHTVDVRTGGETRAPGALDSHYAPNARVVLVADEHLASRAAAEIAAGQRVGVLASKPPDFLDDAVVVVGTPADADEYARTLYRNLRDADERGLDVVLAVVPTDVGIGAAVADRLRRAARRDARR